MRYIVFLLVFFASVTAWSQSIAFLYKGQIENSDLGKREGGVKVAVVQNGATLFFTTTASNGKYALRGEINYTIPFEIVFSKVGLVSKKVSFDFARMNEEDIPPGEFRPVESLDMSLFKSRDNVDFSFLNSEAVAKFDWNTRQMAPRLDAVAMTNMKNRILKLLADADKNKAQAEINYQKAITAADKFFTEKKYEQSLAKYEEALGYKPIEPYPAQKILELEALIQSQQAAELADKQENEAYYNLIEAADNLRDQGNLEPAVSKYKEALALKAEQYPKDQIAAITKQILDKKKEEDNQLKYDSAITKGKMFLKQNSLRAAKDKFSVASKLKPSEQFPKVKLKEIEDKLNAQLEQETIKKKYNAAITEADALYNAADFESSKIKYEEAISFESAATYPKERVKLCDKAIADANLEKAKQEQISQLIKVGITSMTSEDWDQAKTNFNEVLTIDSENSIAKEKLALIEIEIEKANNLAQQEESFNSLVKEGDAAFASEQFEDALIKYTEAKSINATPEVQSKIDETNNKIKELKELADIEAADKLKQETYDAAIAEADNAFDSSNWKDAKQKYEAALTIDNTQNYPTEQIAKIVEQIAEEQSKAEQEAEALAKKEAYDAAISAADHAFDLANWDEATTKYREAMSFDASQNYPNERLTIIEEKIAKEKAIAEQEASDAKAKAEQEAAEQAKIASYNTAISAADNAFNLANWDEAKAKYQEAIKFDASQSYPSDRLTEIDDLIAEEKAKDIAAKEAKTLKEKYDATIAQADNMFSLSDFENAITKYKEAALLDGSKSYPADQITKIEQLVSEQQSKAEQEAAAKEKKEAYNNAIMTADNAFNASNWDEAIVKYRESQLLDASESYPGDQIEKIEKLVAGQKSKADAEAAVAELKANISKLLSEGELLFGQSKLEDAKSKFQQVLLLEGDNLIAKSRLDEIETRIRKIEEESSKEGLFNQLKDAGYQLVDVKKYNEAKSKLKRALEIKNDATIVAKIDDINRLIAEKNAAKSIDSEYSTLLELASKKEISHDYNGAISSYNEALVIKPEESFPQQKINELKNLLENEKEAKTIDEKYRKSMNRGDDFMTHKDYLNAIQAYNEALSFKPLEQEPVDKAAEAEKLEKAKDQDSDKQYEKIITVAQNKINSAEYTRAIELLNRAKGLRPTDDRPQKMLDRIELLKQQEDDFIALMNEGNSLATKKQYKDAIVKFESAGRKKPTAIEPNEKIAEMRGLITSLNSINQKNALYSEYMEKGNSFLLSEKYAESLTYFQNALTSKPNDVVAQNKINEVQQILDDLANNKNAELDLKNRFNALVKIADESFSSSKYSVARGEYEKALSLMPNSSYVESQIDACIKQQRLTTVAQAQKEYQKIIKAADNNFNKENYKKAIDYYTRAIGFKPSDPYPKSKLAEINGILHPISVASNDLKDLGDPFDNSIMDGSFILAKAEAERKSLKKTKIERKYRAIQDGATAKTIDNMSDHYRTSNDIYMAYERISIDAGENNLNQDEIAAALRKAKLELENEDSQNIQYEKSENISDQIILYQIVQESNLGNGDRTEITESIKEIHRKAQQIHEVKETYNNENLISDQMELDKIDLAQEKHAKIESIYAQDNNEVLKTGLKELAEAHDNEMYRETSKYQGNKIAIDEEVKTNTKIVDLENKAHAEKVKYVEAMDKKATIQTVAALEGDLQERMDATKEIHDVYANVSENTREEVVKLESNNEDLKELNKTITAKESANNIGEKEDLYAAQAKLNKVTDKQKDKPIIGNSLGEEYPEGVSQESFTKSDQDGLVTTIITRRVVVIEGHANVYVRTQSLHGITYSKNGKPSLSSTWNKETQGPHLERHF